MASDFIHLHTHSHYSLLNALPKVPELVKAAKENGMQALALTDSGNLYGAIEFYKQCKKEEIKPIIGVDFYAALRTRFDKEARIDNKRYRLVLLAKNQEGYKNLIKLVTASGIEGFYYKPRVDKELLARHNNDLIAISPSFSGEIATHLKNRNYNEAVRAADEYRKMFPEFYLEITDHPELEGHAALKEEIINFARKHDIPLVAAHDVYYIKPEDKKARDTLTSVQSHADWGDTNKFGNDTDDFSFISEAAAKEKFKDTPDALFNSVKIAEDCNLELELGKWVFPKIDIPQGTTYDGELRKLVYEGLNVRNLEKTSEVEERIEYELKVIKDKGYAPYFLVVSDLLRFAHENDIFTTIRGSVAGSLVTYLARITTVNPLEYKLPFERFLNPERPSAPDIDMDYADNRRDEVIHYAKQKYGEDNVAQIGTFGTMMARGAVRDVTRALGYPYGTGDRIAKLIPLGAQGFAMTIDRAFSLVPELKAMYKEEQEVRDIIDLAKKIEGCARHISVHAAGVVIAPSALTDFTPIQLDPKGGKMITQYDMHSVEDAGLLKFDFLGIKNLAILADSVKLVKKVKDIDIDMDNIPLDDLKTFEMLAHGETMGLFQLNGSGMTRYLKELKPSTIHDINAMVALYRPGPMESIPFYIERKHNPSLVKYLDPRMKEILSQSYGVITYQDDVMLIAIHLAGYSWLEADKLRKAMGKKIPAEMAAQKEKLLEGFLKNGLSKEKANELWKLIEPFAAYGFNKAHAASYGRVAYQTAYMKANFPALYMSAVLTADSGDTEKVSEIITECKRMKIPVLPPDINESFGNFTVVEESGLEKIRFGLYSIKNFGEGIANTIIEERKKNGKYTSLADFLSRIKDRNLNKKSLEALVKCGAMDAMGERGTILHNMENILYYNKENMKVPDGQDSLFGMPGTEIQLPPLRLEKVFDASKDQKLLWEKELLGLYISGHPLDQYKEKLAQLGASITRTRENFHEGQTSVVAGLIEEAKPIMTKKGDRMLFLKIVDEGGNIEVVIFPKVLEEFKDLLTNEKCVAIQGRMSGRNGTPSIVAEKVKLLT